MGLGFRIPVFAGMTRMERCRHPAKAGIQRFNCQVIWEFRVRLAEGQGPLLLLHSLQNGTFAYGGGFTAKLLGVFVEFGLADERDAAALCHAVGA